MRKRYSIVDYEIFCNGKIIVLKPDNEYYDFDLFKIFYSIKGLHNVNFCFYINLNGKYIYYYKNRIGFNGKIELMKVNGIYYEIEEPYKHVIKGSMDQFSKADTKTLLLNSKHPVPVIRKLILNRLGKDVSHYFSFMNYHKDVNIDEILNYVKGV